MNSLKTKAFVRFSIKEQTLFAKRLSFLIKAGMPILECLHLIRAQTRSRRKAKIFDSIITDVAGGKFLATSLKKYGALFGEFTINLIGVGEQSGILSENLAYVADELSKKHALQRKIRGALIYPIFITLATLGVTSLLTIFIFPKIVPIFVSLHIELPLTTRIFLAVSQYLQHWGLLTLVFLVLGMSGIVLLRRVLLPLRYFGDRLLVSLPVAGTIARAYNLANFCRTLGLLLRSGIHLTEALPLGAAMTKNLVYRGAFERLGRQVTKGEPMSRSLEANRALFPDTLTHLVAVGESSGNLTTTLLYLSELYEGELDEHTKNLSNAVEPLLMIFMGVLVGLVAVSVILPIYEITQNLQR